MNGSVISMKIMTAMYTLKKGGAYGRFIMMLEAFLERGCHVHCLSLTPIPIDHPLYSNHVVPFPFRIRNGFLARGIVLLVFPFYLLFMGWREKIELIVAFGPLYAFLQALSKRVLRRPMVTLIRSDLSSSPGRRIPNKGLKALSKIIGYVGIRASDRIIANNSATQQEMILILKRQENVEVHLLFNNVPSIPPVSEGDLLQTRTCFGIPKEGKLVATAGVLTPGKNFEVLLRCLRNVGVPGLSLAIIGDGSSEADIHYVDGLRKLARRLDLEKKVIFTGWVEKGKLWRLLRAADLFILPSLKEGMPNVLLEALGCDVPCLGSNIPGIRDILCHETLMFDPHDDEGLTEKLKLFFSDEAYRKGIMHLCYEQMEKFCFDWKERVFSEVTKQEKFMEPQE
jgi:glycosyltransferase involved in cell wall biosynthesis